MPVSMRAVFGSAALLACAVVGWCACDSKVVDTYSYQTIEVGYGDTCGNLQNEPGNVFAQCDGGADTYCHGQVSSYPEAGLGLQVGVCTQVFTNCDDAGCPSGFICIDGFPDDRTSGLCLRACNTSADCEAPFQLCELGECATQACIADEDCEDSTAHCSDNLCVRGDAETR